MHVTDLTSRIGSNSAASTSSAHRSCTCPQQRASQQLCRGSVQRATSQNPDSGNSFAENIGQLFRRVRAKTPIVGLLANLASSTGTGVDEISYPEYCREIYNRKSDKFNKAMEELEAKQGRVRCLRQTAALHEKMEPARPRYALLMLWMAFTGAGLVSPNLVMASARRVRVTFDMEIEIERFEGARDDKIKEFGVASKPKKQLQEQMNLAVDALCQLLFGVPEGKLPSAEQVKLLRALITSVVGAPDAADAVQQALLTKPKRLKVS